MFGQTFANCVAAMMRSAAGRVALRQGGDKAWGEWIDRYIHGHRGNQEDSLPRFSYLPLPSLERRGRGSVVLGGIRRVLVAELVEAAESHLDWARQMLPGQFLTDEKIADHQRRKRALLTPLAGGDWVLRQYIDSAETWASVTPVVLPGSDDGKYAKTEKLFFKALRHAGYSPEALATVEFRNVSYWPGGELALGFRRPDYLRKGFWSVYHVRLRWKAPVPGPIALGAGRHCGLGIFAATTL
jgi:CRISPR-associated protein Csb2